MKPLFADASFYIAVTNPRDELHLQARELARTLRGRVVTTDFILIETANWLSQTGDRDLFKQLYRQLSLDPHTVMVPASRDWFERGRNLYIQRPDKDWSLTDCISFVVMDEHGVSDALTADHHFEQAGFRALLR